MPFAKGFKIREIHAYICTDEDGTEGVAAKEMGGTLVPLLAADAARLNDLQSHAEEVATQTNTEVTLAKFSVRTDLETIKP